MQAKRQIPEFNLKIHLNFSGRVLYFLIAV